MVHLDIFSIKNLDILLTKTSTRLDEEGGGGLRLIIGGYWLKNKLYVDECAYIYMSDAFIITCTPLYVLGSIYHMLCLV